MTTAVATQDQSYSREKIDLIKQTVAVGATDLELQLFLHACQRTGLDPLMKQIHAIKRWNSALHREAMTIQTGIDGYRLIAERTKAYAPGAKPTFLYEEGKLISATAYIKKRTDDGVWHVVEGEAFYDEYVQLTKTGEVTSMWKKPRMMLAKCAEALALRKAFPAELSGVYTHEEMMQADKGEAHAPPPAIEHAGAAPAVAGVSEPSANSSQLADGAPADHADYVAAQAELLKPKLRTGTSSKDVQAIYDGVTDQAVKNAIYDTYASRLKELARRK